jgi:hypothetical protein
MSGLIRRCGVGRSKKGACCERSYTGYVTMIGQGLLVLWFLVVGMMKRHIRC